MSNINHKTCQLYLLAGQSNMDGMGFVSDLPEELNQAQPDVLIYNPNRKRDGEPVENLGQWEALRPGHGSGHRIVGDGNGQAICSNRFGPELTFASWMKEYNPNQKIALFKYAKGGSSIHRGTPDDWGCWDPDYAGTNQWTHFAYHYKRAIRVWENDVNNEKVLEPTGLIWMQGESDAAYSREIAESYAHNLEKVITKIRGLTGKYDLPVVIGQISETGMEGDKPALPHAAIVQQAQQEFVNQNSNASLIRPHQNYGWLDAWHYDSETYLELGNRCAEAMNELVELNK